MQGGAHCDSLGGPRGAQQGLYLHQTQTPSWGGGKGGDPPTRARTRPDSVHRVPVRCWSGFRCGLQKRPPSWEHNKFGPVLRCSSQVSKSPLAGVRRHPVAAMPLVALWKLGGFSTRKVFKYLLRTGLCSKGRDVAADKTLHPLGHTAGVSNTPGTKPARPRSEARQSALSPTPGTLPGSLPLLGPAPRSDLCLPSCTFKTQNSDQTLRSPPNLC